MLVPLYVVRALDRQRIEEFDAQASGISKHYSTI